LPIFIVGRDVRVPAENDLAGLLRNPSWVALNRRTYDPPYRNGWYNNLAVPAPGCLDAEQNQVGADAECDEFPFWSNLQAHNGTLNVMEASIRWAPYEENRLEGRALGKFYGTGAPGKFPWPGCDVTAQAPTDVLPILSSTFLVVPLPFSATIKTRGVCNKP
jgi:hypothetical protein